jgi:uncharacterized protein (TIGR04255 family)
LEASRAAHLPNPVNFDRPPVNEVVMGVQFSTPVLNDVTVLTEFWPLVREDFPRLEKQPAIPPATEDFGVAQTAPSFQIQFGTEGPSPRYWLLSETGTELIQLQQDRFLINWRQLQPTDEYPRYAHLRERFLREYGLLRTALGEARWQTVNVDLCEISYINHIPAEIDGSTIQLSDVLTAVPPFSQEEATVLPQLEDSNLQARFVLRGWDGRSAAPTGRMYLGAGHAVRGATQENIYALNLLVRGRPSGQTIEDAIDFFDEARMLIVRGFRELTTEGMHQFWGARP